jgi:hypothetical protein
MEKKRKKTIGISFEKERDLFSDFVFFVRKMKNRMKFFRLISEFSPKKYEKKKKTAKITEQKINKLNC